MKKYQLFSEFCDAEIYGNDFTDALLNANLHKAGRWDKKNQVLIPGPEIHIVAIIGSEDTANSTRGNDKFERAIAELSDGKRISIDGKVVCDITEGNKRLRQVRDALNKCKNQDVIEQIGKLLNI